MGTISYNLCARTFIFEWLQFTISYNIDINTLSFSPIRMGLLIFLSLLFCLSVLLLWWISPLIRGWETVQTKHKMLLKAQIPMKGQLRLRPMYSWRSCLAEKWMITNLSPFFWCLVVYWYSKTWLIQVGTDICYVLSHLIFFYFLSWENCSLSLWFPEYLHGIEDTDIHSLDKVRLLLDKVNLFSLF